MNMKKIISLILATGALSTCASAAETALFDDSAKDVTRAQAAGVIYRLLSDPNRIIDEAPFSDVLPETANAGAINQLFYAGVISGFGDNTFRPDDKLTAVQLLVMCENITNYSAFLDSSLEWKEGYMKIGKEYGFLNGTDIAADDFITPADAEKMLQNTLSVPIAVTDGLTLDSESGNLVPKVSISDGVFLKIN